MPRRLSFLLLPFPAATRQWFQHDRRAAAVTGRDLRQEMMGDFVPFGTGRFWLIFVVLLVARGMDFLSTWVATPNMVLEGNPIAKKLGWKFGIPINAALCVGFAFWELPAIVIS